MYVERPLVKKPLIPEQGNNPPEIPHKGFAVEEPVCPVGIAKCPGAKVSVIVTNVVQDAEEKNAAGSEPEGPPGIHI